MSTLRDCHIFKAKNNKFYLELETDENSEIFETYGPFDNINEANAYLDNFSNPGGYTLYENSNFDIPKVAKK